MYIYSVQMCPVWAACSKPRRVVLIQGLTKTELPEAPGGAKQRITAEPSLRVQAAHLCGCCASNPDINSSKFHKTSENIYSLPVWFWQFRRRLVRFVQNDNGGTTNARTETSECIINIIKLYDVYKAAQVCPSSREFGHKHCDRIQQWLSRTSSCRLSDKHAISHVPSALLDSTSIVQLGDYAYYALQWSARFMIKYSDTLAHEEKWKGGKMWKGISLKSILPQVT